MLKNDIHILNNMIAVVLDVSIWTARKKITPEDFGLNGKSLPPEELASLGSKRIAPQESLRIFGTLKSRAVSILDKVGVRFIGGWLIPEAKIVNVYTELDSVSAEFEWAKGSFMQSYQSVIDEWLGKYSNWRSMLEQAIEAPESVASKLTFSYHTFRIITDGSTNLQSKTQTVASAVFDDVAKQANDIWNNVLKGRSSVTHKALSPLKALEAKLEGLTFVEPHIQPVAALIHSLLGALPKRGNITGVSLASLQGVVCLMRDKEELIKHASNIIDGADPMQLPSIDLVSARNSTINSFGLW